MEIWYYIVVDAQTNIIKGVQQAYAPGIVWPEYYHVDRNPMLLMGEKVTRLEKISEDPEVWSFDSEPVPQPEPETPTELK